MEWNRFSKIAKSICERARKVEFMGESANEEWMGTIEIMSGKGGVMEIHIERSALKKYSHKQAKWHTQSVYATIDAEAWKHLTTAE